MRPSPRGQRSHDPTPFACDAYSESPAASSPSRGPGSTLSGDYTANCTASGITLVKVIAGDQTDKVANSTAVASSLDGGPGNDAVIGGSAADTLTGGTGVDTLKGLAGNDQLLARDLTSDASIDCSAGSDKADLDKLPKDPNSVVSGCETKTRH